MTPVWPVLNRKSADSFTQFCLFFQSFFFFLPFFFHFTVTVCTVYLFMMYKLFNNSYLTYLTIFNTVMVKSTWSMFPYFFQQKKFTVWPQFAMSPDFIIVSQITFHCSRLLFHAVREHTVALYLVPVWQPSMNYLTDSVRVKQTDRRARHQLL